MKPTAVIILMISLSLKLHAQKNTMTAQDSIKTFYNELFAALKQNYLHKKAVDWQVTESATKQSLTQYNTFEGSLSEVRVLFDRIGANHCSVYVKQKKYAATGKHITKQDYSEQWKKKYDAKPGFEAKVINGKYGYILMPAMAFFDVSAKNLHQIAQPLYDQIAAVKTKTNLEGWIIDLRFNTGGNEAPMLMCLYDFLGDNDIWGSLNVDKKQESKVKLSKGKYINKTQTISYIEPKGELLDKARIAVITGVFTASSGEVTALAFKGRPNTLFVGETTYGATTGNIIWPLPFNNIMALTTSYDSDRNGVYYKQIIPDVMVSKQDNFDDLLLDKNIQECIKYIVRGQ